MKKILLLVIFPLFLSAGSLKIAAAANIGYVLEDLKTEFNKIHPDIKISANLGASGAFAHQIKNGAFYDVFLSANMDFPKSLEKEKNAKAIPYAKGRLLLFVPKNKASLDYLKTANCIAIANPNSAPYGKAAKEVLSKVPSSNKIIKASSIANTLSQILSACESGFIAASSKNELLKRGFTEDNFLLIDESLHEPILQGMILLSSSSDARDFYEFLQSPRAKKVFKKHGYE